MSRLPAKESDTVEFKESWTDKALKDLAAFANSRGGRLYVGVSDKGKIVGATSDDHQQLLVANQIESKLRIAAEVTSATQQGNRLLVVTIPRAQRLVRLDGRYHRRVGTASMEMSEDEVAVRLRAQTGKTWDEEPADATIERDISVSKVRAFIRSAKELKPCRLPKQISARHPLPVILRNLDLLADACPTNAAILLFGKQPQRFYPSACIRAGFFRDNNDFDMFPDCGGTIFEQIEHVIQQVESSYPIRMTFPSEVRKLTDRRKETPAFPPAALREAVVNAAIHRDYMHPGMEIEVKMFPDFIWVSNPGGLPPDVTLAALKIKPHISSRRNPLIAKICFMNHLVERYGTGTTRMIDECREGGFPMPEFNDTGGTFQVTLRRQVIAQQVADVLASEWNSRQQAALQHVAAHGSLTPVDYQKLTGVSDRSARRDLKQLVNAGLLKREGTREGLRYFPGPKA